MHLGIRWGWKCGLHGGCNPEGRLPRRVLDRVHKVAGCRSQKLPCEGLLPLRGRRLSSERLGGRTGSGLHSGHHCSSGSVGQLLQPLRGQCLGPVKPCYRRPYQAVNHSLGAAQILRTVQGLRTAKTSGTAHAWRAAHELDLVRGLLLHGDGLASGQIRTSHGWGEGLSRA